MSGFPARRRIAPAALGALLALACAESGSGPGELGQLRILPAFTAGEEPAVFGVEVETIRVIARRGGGSGTVVVDTTLAFEPGRTLAWLLDLTHDPDDITVDLALAAHGVTRYRGTRGVTLPASIGEAAPLHEVMVRYVGPALAAIEVTPPSAILRQAGSTTAFSAQARDAGGAPLDGFLMHWSSSDPAVAGIDAESGLVTAVGPGSTTISASSAGVVGTATLRVTRVRSVELLPDSAGLAAFGATQAYTAIARDEDGQVVTGAVIAWASSDPAVVSIDQATGVATAVGNGSATITVQADGIGGAGRLDVRQRVVSVSVSPSQGALTALGATTTFSGDARDANGYRIADAVFGWASGRPGVATVDATSGAATAVGTGTVQIQATAGGVSGSATLDVSQVIASIAVTPGVSVLPAPGTQQFSAVARDANGHAIPGVQFAWSSSTPLVASVDPSGVATAVSTGATSITAQAGGVQASASLTITQGGGAGTLSVTPIYSALTTVGATQQFSAEVRDGQGNRVPGVSFAWSSNPAIATVDPTGLATAVGPGTTTITAKGAGLTGSATLEVVLGIWTITLTPGSATLTALGASQPFTAVARDFNNQVIPGVQFSWSSTQSGVASIAANGTAMATGNGTTTIRAAAGGKLGVATLGVAQSVASVDVAPGSATLIWPGPSRQFSAVARDANGHPVSGVAISWSSSAPRVASVDPGTGLVTPLSAGGATITASGGGSSGSASVQVNSPVTTVTVSPGQSSIVPGSTQQFSATVLDANGLPVPGATVLWASSDPAVAIVDPATGLATGTGSGSATITADAGGVQGSAVLSVVSIARVVVSAPGSTTIQPGATLQLTATAFDAAGNAIPGVHFLWSSTAPGILAVDPASGLVTAIAGGVAVITATAPGGAHGEIELRAK